ncbi:hypothetical protein H1R20_g8138, partial [Candolleomyces eurysporus]
MNTETNREAWTQIVAKYQDAIAIGAERSAYIFFTTGKRQPIRIDLPKEPPEKLIPADKICVAWVLGHSALNQPLVLISRGSLLYIYNPESTGMAGQPNNPHWPPSKQPSLAGAPHGLHINEPEGSGLGRCIIVLMGGRSGGHQAAVLGAAFHPYQPLLATCGMDRCVKIWDARAINTDQITRKDKPLFSSSRLHKARVLSVTWLDHDILLTHSAPAMMRNIPGSSTNKKTYLEPGEFIVWRWLGMNRFFPPLQQDLDSAHPFFRGCASDYLESSSFKFITIYSFPPVPNQYVVPHLHAFVSRQHDPLALTAFPESDRFLITSIAQLDPREMPTFDEVREELIHKDSLLNFDETSNELAEATDEMHLGEEARGGSSSSSKARDAETRQEGGTNTSRVQTTNAQGLGGRVGEFEQTGRPSPPVYRDDL